MAKITLTPDQQTALTNLVNVLLGQTEAELQGWINNVASGQTEAAVQQAYSLLSNTDFLAAGNQLTADLQAANRENFQKMQDVRVAVAALLQLALTMGLPALRALPILAVA